MTPSHLVLVRTLMFYCALNTYMSGVVSGEPFPNEISGETVILERGHVYHVNETVEWIGGDRLIISGNGATVIVDSDLDVGFFFKGRKWIWEGVNIVAPGLETLFEFESIDKGYFQMRSCIIRSQSKVEITIYGSMDSISFQNNRFTTTRNSASFFKYDTNMGRLNWRGNTWEGNYTMFAKNIDSSSMMEKNMWNVQYLSANFLNMGEFRHEDGETWCVPPSKWKSTDSVYHACTNEWFVESIGKIPKVFYSPMKSTTNDSSFPESLIFSGNSDVDFGGNKLSLKSITTTVGARLNVTGLDCASLDNYFQVFSMHNSTVEFEEMNCKGPDRRIELTMSTEDSNVFFWRSTFDDVEMLGTGLGNVHVQETDMENFILSAPNLWGSRNEFKSGRIITQPYTGHMRDCKVKDTAYHISHYYLGTEPIYRMNFGSNVWLGTSDLVVSSSFNKKIRMLRDVIHSPALGKKISKSNVIQSKEVMDPHKRPIGTSAPKGYIWKSESLPQRCPDGYWAGDIDSYGVPVGCVLCEIPNKSVGGECNNINFGYKATNDKKVGGLKMGSTQDFNPDASYYGQTPQSEFEQCTREVSLCLGIDPNDINRTSFTLGRWMFRSSNDDYCRKSGLYCMGTCRCESYCVTSDVFLYGFFVGLFTVLGGTFLCFCSICREEKRYITVRNGVQNSECIGDEGPHPCNYDDNFCRVCGAHTVGGHNRRVERSTEGGVPFYQEIPPTSTTIVQEAAHRKLFT